MVIGFLLPEGRKPDSDISLRPGAIVRGYLEVLANEQFQTYAIAGAFSFAGLFVYVTGSPIIFIDTFHLGPHAFGLAFALLAGSFIVGSQINIWLSRRVDGRSIFWVAVVSQNVILLIALLGTSLGWYGLIGNIALLLVYLPICGAAYPNAAALALSPFSKNVGSAAAMLGFLQMAIGSLASTGVGLLQASSSLPIFAVMTGTAMLGFIVLAANQRREGLAAR
jgi:DHA1 family bicyclomycin/chloramphenicol resistance-like MFS transporter